MNVIIIIKKNKISFIITNFDDYSQKINGKYEMFHKSLSISRRIELYLQIKEINLKIKKKIQFFKLKVFLLLLSLYSVFLSF